MYALISTKSQKAQIPTKIAKEKYTKPCQKVFKKPNSKINTTLPTVRKKFSIKSPSKYITQQLLQQKLHSK